MEADFKKLVRLLNMNLPKDTLQFENGKLKLYTNNFELMDHLTGFKEELIKCFKIKKKESTFTSSLALQVYNSLHDKLIIQLHEQEELKNRYKEDD